MNEDPAHRGVSRRAMRAKPACPGTGRTTHHHAARVGSGTACQRPPSDERRHQSRVRKSYACKATASGLARQAATIRGGWIGKTSFRCQRPLVISIRSYRDARDWTPTLRRAEVKHALNQRESATADYTRAIELHPNRGVPLSASWPPLITRKICDGAMRDFAQAIRLAPTSVQQDYNLTAELYSLQSGVYASCPDGAFRDGRRAVETAAQAVSLDPSRPTLLTILAAAYASANDFSRAVQFQQRALNSSRFPSGYRDEAERQLRQYRESLTLQSTGR